MIRGQLAGYGLTDLNIQRRTPLCWLRAAETGGERRADAG